MERDDVRRITFVGDLTMVGMTVQFPLLAEYLAEPVKNGALPPADQQLLEIDLTRIDALDACGCQMLVAFMRNLRRRGAVVPALKLAGDARDVIHTLGFELELFGGECA